MKADEHIQYWIDSSDDDFQAMIHLSEKGNNTWALFIGHLVLEKLIKAWYVKVNSKTPPFIHDLVRLAEKGNLALDDEQKDILDTISTFNIRGRYDDYKREFHKKCTNTFTKTWIDHIKRLRKWIKIKFQI
ncbi:MAG: HEPN domain-containing protein [Deltaproteobacteria bacterium]|jgi:HEPN domain-containing protein|nr:HEPN domain-containing protein [Deltaproteobacteria bacterium]